MRRAVVMIVTLWACGPGASSVDRREALVRVSAGVRVVEYAGEPSAMHELSFSSAPAFRHGHRSGDYTFQFVSVGVLQPDDAQSIAVYQLISRRGAG